MSSIRLEIGDASLERAEEWQMRNRVVASRSSVEREPVFVAHLVLVRKLSHHGRVAHVNASTGA